MEGKKIAAGTGAVVVDPPFAEYAPLTQDSSHHTLRNPTEKVLAVKVKCSDNAFYRVRPVFALIPPQSSVTLDVARASEPPKHDKLVIQSLECAADVGEGQVELLFKAPGVAPLFNTIRLKCGDDPVSITTRSTKSSHSSSPTAAEPKAKSGRPNSKAQASQKKRDEGEADALRKKEEEDKKKAAADKSKKKDMTSGPAVKQHDLPGHEKKKEIVHLGLKEAKKDGHHLNKKPKDAHKKK